MKQVSFRPDGSWHISSCLGFSAAKATCMTSAPPPSATPGSRVTRLLCRGIVPGGVQSMKRRKPDPVLKQLTFLYFEFPEDIDLNKYYEDNFQFISYSSNQNCRRAGCLAFSKSEHQASLSTSAAYVEDHHFEHCGVLSG